jgi:hypothetical protein
LDDGTEMVENMCVIAGCNEKWSNNPVDEKGLAGFSVVTRGA